MAMILKQSTIVSVKVGPFLDEDDGKTTETGLTVPQSAVRLTKLGGNFAEKNSGTSATHDEFGWYDVPLNATDTNTVGPLLAAIHGTGALPVWREFQVVEEDTYEFLMASGASPDTDVALILADTDELQQDDYPARFTTVDNYTQATLADTGTSGVQIGADAITAASIGDYAILAINIGTDAIGAAEIAANAIGASELATDAAQEIRDEILSDSTAFDGADVALILTDTAEIGTGGVGLDSIPWNAAWDAEVESEVNDALDSAISELGVAAPSATPTIRTGLMLLYMALRNKTVVQTSGTDALEIYNNAGTKIAAKLLTDDGDDYTEAEMA